MPNGAWVISAESWSPARRRAGRLRRGFERGARPPGVTVLSDLLLLAPSNEAAPTSLAGALPRTLPSAEIGRGEGLAVAWEATGLGVHAETLSFEVSVDRTDRGVVRKLGEFLRVAGRPASVTLSWEESVPRTTQPFFEHRDLSLPYLDPGEYSVTVTLGTVGRSDVVSRTSFRLR